MTGTGCSAVNMIHLLVTVMKGIMCEQMWSGCFDCMGSLCTTAVMRGIVHEMAKSNGIAALAFMRQQRCLSQSAFPLYSNIVAWYCLNNKLPANADSVTGLHAVLTSSLATASSLIRFLLQVLVSLRPSGLISPSALCPVAHWALTLWKSDLRCNRPLQVQHLLQHTPWCHIPAPL